MDGEPARRRRATGRADPPTVFDYSKQGGFFRSVELCNGVGRVPQDAGRGDVPVVPRDARRARHARAAGRTPCGIALTGRVAATPSRARRRSRIARALGARGDGPVPVCKACKSECPSNVDVAKLKAEFLQAYYARRPRPLGHLLVKNVHRLSPLAAPVRRAGQLARRAGRSCAG